MGKDKNEFLIGGVILGLFILVSLPFFFWDSQFDFLKEFLKSNPYYAPAIFIAVEILSIVVAPVVTLPLIPFMVGLIGSLATAIYATIGWTVGAIIAFLIARHFGRPLISKFVSLETIEKYEQRVSENTQFISLVLIRMVLPIDVISYAYGFFSGIAFWKYALATLIGTIPLTFVIAYAGGALISGQFSDLIYILVFGLIIFLVSWSVLRKTN